MVYPGNQFLGYDKESERAWFEDYKGRIEGPLDQVEQDLYLWAIVEDAFHMTIENSELEQPLARCPKCGIKTVPDHEGLDEGEMMCSSCEEN